MLLHMAGPLLKTSRGSKFFWQGMLLESLQLMYDGSADRYSEILSAALK